MKLSFVCMILFFCTGIIAQEKTSNYDTLIQQAQELHQKKEYDRAIPLYLQCISMPQAEETKWALEYNVSCCYSLIHDSTNAIIHLEQSIRNGYTEFRKIKNDPDFGFLAKECPARFDSLIRLAQDVGENIRLAQSPIVIRRYDNYAGTTDLSKYLWDDYDNPQMDSLRMKYDFVRMLKQGTTEFEKMRLMLNWVSTRWKHNGNNTAKSNNALTILAWAEQGEQFACRDYGIVLTECLNAAGLPARAIGICREGASLGKGKGHTVTEAWSNQYQKWIVLDGQNNAWWESGGIPLNAGECRTLLINHREEEMKFQGQHNNVDYASLTNEWNGYFHHLFISYNNSFFKKYARSNESRFEFISDKIIPELYLDGDPYILPPNDNYEDVYPRLNQTKIKFRHINDMVPSDSLTVELSHTMPYFKNYLVRIDSGEWRESPGTFLWVLKSGENLMEAKAVNLAGIEGRTSSIMLRNNILLNRK